MNSTERCPPHESLGDLTLNEMILHHVFGYEYERDDTVVGKTPAIPATQTLTGIWKKGDDILTRQQVPKYDSDPNMAMQIELHFSHLSSWQDYTDNAASYVIHKAVPGKKIEFPYEKSSPKQKCLAALKTLRQNITKWDE